MPEEKKQPLLHPEVTFLPPLEMTLSSFEMGHKRALKKQEDEKKKETEEKSVTKLIEKLEQEK